MGENCEKLHFGSPKINIITEAYCLLTFICPILTLFKYMIDIGFLNSKSIILLNSNKSKYIF